MLLLSCLLYEREENYFASGSTPLLELASCASAGQCLGCLYGMAQENFVECVTLTVLCAPFTYYTARTFAAIGARELLRLEFQARACEAGQRLDFFSALELSDAVSLRRAELGAAR